MERKCFIEPQLLLTNLIDPQQERSHHDSSGRDEKFLILMKWSGDWFLTRPLALRSGESAAWSLLDGGLGDF